MLKSLCLRKFSYKYIAFLVLICNPLHAQVPVIFSFSPSGGAIGTTITISGSNFSAGSVNNIVLFGVARAAVTSATATELQDKVPPGASYQPISVTANGLTATSSKPFDVTFAGAGPFAANSFSQRMDLPVPTYPRGVLAADLDGDGKTDIVDYNNNTLSVFRNTSTVGSTSFSTNQDIVPGGSIDNVFIADLDGDGKADLVYADGNDKKFVILKNTSALGVISFAPPMFISDTSIPTDITVADFDNDGKPDIAVSNGITNTFSVYRSTTSNGVLSLNPQ